jgi:hypothetical protein
MQSCFKIFKLKTFSRICDLNAFDIQSSESQSDIAAFSCTVCCKHAPMCLHRFAWRFCCKKLALVQKRVSFVCACWALLATCGLATQVFIDRCLSDDRSIGI